MIPAFSGRLCFQSKKNPDCNIGLQLLRWEKGISEVENIIALNGIPELVLKRELLSKDLNQLLGCRADFLMHRAG